MCNPLKHANAALSAREAAISKITTAEAPSHCLPFSL
jgi:hypothetical protein